MFIVSLCLSVFVFGQSRRTVTVLEPPGVASFPQIGENSAILVNGRKVTPAGKFIRVQSYNWGMALSPDERMAALVNADAITLISLGGEMTARRIPQYGIKPSAKQGKGTYMGCAFSPDGRLL